MSILNVPQAITQLSFFYVSIFALVLHRDICSLLEQGAKKSWLLSMNVTLKVSFTRS